MVITNFIMVMACILTIIFKEKIVEYIGIDNFLETRKRTKEEFYSKLALESGKCSYDARNHVYVLYEKPKQYLFNGSFVKQDDDIENLIWGLAKKENKRVVCEFIPVF